MKKSIPILISLFFLAACNTTPSDMNTNSAAIPGAVTSFSQPDTTGLAQYNQWKAQHELNAVYMNTPSSGTSSRSISPVKSVHKKPALVTSKSKSASKEIVSNRGASEKGGSVTSSSSGEAKAAQKKGISKAAKGAVIGGVVGAAGGAVISRNNRVLGAVIGGVIGAAGGYGIGRKMDKKDGRIEYASDPIE